MSIKKVSKKQPEFFEFSEMIILKAAENEIKKYPKEKKQALLWHYYI